jgi:hypothetical protein
MQRQRSPLLQIGIGLFLAGIAVKVIVALSASLLSPLASLAIVAGIVLAVLGLVLPGRR